jgi:hypothetical protein
MLPSLIFAAAIVLVALVMVGVRRLAGRKGRRLSEFQFPDHALRAAVEAYPGVQPSEVATGLRQYYSARLQTGGRTVAMPSVIIETARRAFVEDHEAFRAFALDVFGKELVDDPVTDLTDEEREEHYQYDMARAWEGACEAEGLEVTDRGAPLLFDIDRENGVPGATTYVGYCDEWAQKLSPQCRAGAGVVCMMHTYPSVRSAAKFGTSDSDGVVV